MMLLEKKCKSGLSLLKKMKLAWYKNGFGEESDSLLSKAPCNASQRENRPCVGGGRFAKLVMHGLAKGVCMQT